jgi:hypothetical protein
MKCDIHNSRFGTVPDKIVYHMGPIWISGCKISDFENKNFSYNKKKKKKKKLIA